MRTILFLIKTHFELIEVTTSLMACEKQRIKLANWTCMFLCEAAKPLKRIESEVYLIIMWRQESDIQLQFTDLLFNVSDA